MKEYIAKSLIRIALWVLPFTPQSHKAIEPILNGWVNRLNDEWWGLNPKDYQD